MRCGVMACDVRRCEAILGDRLMGFCWCAGRAAIARGGAGGPGGRAGGRGGDAAADDGGAQGSARAGNKAATGHAQGTRMWLAVVSASVYA